MSATNPSKFYLTTPIYYVNARPHIGHAYTTIVADVLARRHRLLGDDTFFLTGTDEHGQKIARSAAAAGIPPQQFADQVSKSFADLWKRMGIARDPDDPLFHYDFIRTTDPRHQRGVQKLFSELYARGFIYLASYTGQYCVSDEAFVDAAPGQPCPDCGRPTETLTEENFFFKLSEFQLPLLDLIESNTLLITPEARRNEVLSFLRGNVSEVLATASEYARDFSEEVGKLNNEELLEFAVNSEELALTASKSPYIPGILKGLSISRSSFTWGIPVPEPAASAAKQKHVIYVWLDALANYMTALGYGSDHPADIARFEKFWPADLHLVGKEIIRFHCVYWPAFLLALNPRLQHKSNEKPPVLTPEEHREWAAKMVPKAVTAHGWLLFDNSKMSKSKGNIVRTETILDAFGDHVYAKQFPNSTKAERDLFASDVLRYFLLREIPFGQDGSFSFDALITRYNADLANGYGNLVSRTLTLVEQNLPNGWVKPTIPWLCRDRNVFREGDEPRTREEAQSGTHFIISEVTRLIGEYAEFWNTHRFQVLLAGAQLRIGFVDSYLSFHKPWILAKSSDPVDKKKLIEVLYTAAESIRIITALLYPILPYATARVWAQLGLGDIELAAREGKLSNLQWGGLKPGTKLGPLSPIFPRADKGLAQIMTDMEERNAPATGNSKLTTELDPTQPCTSDPSHPGAPPRTSSLDTPTGPLTVGGSSALSTGPHPTPSHTEIPASGIFANQPASSTPATTGNQEPATGNQAPTTDNQEPTTPQITIDDFAKIELRVAQIVVAERIPKADKLLRLEVDLGYERRQILSGIAEFYTPEELIGRRIVVITNLAPRKMRGLESHGMLLAASADTEDGKPGKPILATMSEDIALGSRLK